MMKLNELYKDKVMDFITRDPDFNIYLIGNIYNYGMSNGFIDVWGSFNEEKIDGILLRFFNVYIPYFNKSCKESNEFIKIIQNDKEARFIVGNKVIIDNMKIKFNCDEEHSFKFCKMNRLKEHYKYKNKIKIANINDSKKIYSFNESISEFNGPNNNKIEMIEHTINSNTGRYYYIENEEGKIISIVQTAAENPKGAMIVNVATANGYRGKGYVTEILSKICNDFIEENKCLYLFFDNDDAGKIYKKVGFEQIGDWMKLILKA